MKVAVVLFGIFLASISQANSRFVNRQKNSDGVQYQQRFVFMEDATKQIQIIDTEAPLPRVTVHEDEVTFHYKSRQTESVELNIFNVFEILLTDFDSNRRTMFVIHGLNNNKDSAMNKEISEALLQVEDWNVIIVDWRKKANSLYPTALASVPQVGTIVAKFISELTEIVDLDLNHVYLSGHSLGAHVCGRAGAVLEGKVAYIVGMDPAFPGVSYDDLDLRLDPSDAKHVHVIHTNGGLLGYFKPLGHADYYPNGGVNQKGCGLDLFGTCAHGRSHKYFAESIVSNGFKATGCESYDDYELGLCFDNDESPMGGNYVDTSAHGEYYLKTSGNEPFALG